MKKFIGILITGASSGVGEALALHYATQDATLFLSGRNKERLDAVAEQCRTRGAVVFPEVLDVTNETGMADWIRQCEDHHPLDLVIANAGISGGTSGGLDAATREVFAANIDGVLNTVHPALTGMRARKSGQIAIVSSLAGLIGMPSAPGYSASKAAVRAYGEALRGRYGKEGIGVSVIVPGFITSGITAQNRFPMPFLMSAKKAAGIIAKGLARNKARIAFPWQMYGLLLMISALPMWLIDRLFSRLPDKT
ncbi:MAG: SDR family NAD(P)-dependent oxidoreductase [Alphaproteobacteria bacterium]|nr:SDR family NAD(P)-dependent oxidoreductase [Alphaproteobacteria bacterium]MBT4019982.1 SDR family NAD(P)-dependent oxidoreductase [Alphaproteobacteria bacterium]MBT4966781.1 SDR family NAD(P)-dependent oxidoreductase [Alphaproteobacteria bacterium]MBT5160938.1 SDR family NAD(P)-dependent oxidoreductase [Alphaproteobacteria bacterium]MBT5919284.1 SDR family NAD(P)-dependent oxidoreductase [Alphaproteobacteria bacterium]